MQGAMTPVTASPNKNLAPEKMILLVCNRACSGHQGKRYGICGAHIMILHHPDFVVVLLIMDQWAVITKGRFTMHIVLFQVWSAFCTVHGAHCDLGYSAKRDSGEDASSVEAWGLHSGKEKEKVISK